MTIIAWDGKMLAADRRRTVTGTPMQATKVKALRDEKTGARWLIGCAGNSHDCAAFMKDFHFGEWDRFRPVNFAALMIADDEFNTIWYMEDRPLLHDITRKSFAIGSGAPYAMGAMEHGATAEEAVCIASRLDIHCGDGCDVVRF